MPEKKQTGQRHWEGKSEEQQAVYANRRRMNAIYGKQLLRKRGELIERSFAHCYDTGGMRRTHLRGHQNILKRLLIHVGAFNLSLIFRNLLGAGTPREWKNRGGILILFAYLLLTRRESPIGLQRSQSAIPQTKSFAGSRRRVSPWRCSKPDTSTTGC